VGTKIAFEYSRTIGVPEDQTGGKIPVELHYDHTPLKAQKVA
jgi:hypothetical protein